VVGLDDLEVGKCLERTHVEVRYETRAYNCDTTQIIPIHRCAHPQKWLHPARCLFPRTDPYQCVGQISLDSTLSFMAHRNFVYCFLASKWTLYPLADQTPHPTTGSQMRSISQILG